MTVYKDLLGRVIPDDHFENEPGPPPKEKPPLSQDLLDHIAAVKKQNAAKQPDES